MGFMVMEAAQMAEKGFSIGEILERLEEMKGQVSTSFIAPSVEPLRKKGKFSRAAYRACKLLDLHPVLTIRRGEMVLSGAYRGSIDRAYGEYIRKAMQGNKNIDTELLFISYAGCGAQQLKEFPEIVQKYRKFDRLLLQKTSATISSNCGLGAMGLSYVTKRADPARARLQ